MKNKRQKDPTGCAPVPKRRCTFYSHRRRPIVWISPIHLDHLRVLIGIGIDCVYAGETAGIMRVESKTENLYVLSIIVEYESTKDRFCAIWTILRLLLPYRYKRYGSMFPCMKNWSKYKPPKIQCVKIWDKYIYVNGLTYVQKVMK